MGKNNLMEKTYSAIENENEVVATVALANGNGISMAFVPDSATVDNDKIVLYCGCDMVCIKFDGLEMINESLFQNSGLELDFS